MPPGFCIIVSMFEKIISVLNKRKLLLLLVFSVVGFNLAYPSHDTDLGWHLAYGQYALANHKLLFHDIYSWTMSGFGWVSISWIYDIFVYLIFTNFGFSALTVISVIVLVLTLASIIIPYQKLNVRAMTFIAFIFIYLLMPVASTGLRPQLLILLLISLINMFIFFSEKRGLKWLIPIPLIMLLWVNLHGTFIIGLFQIYVYIFIKFIDYYFVNNIKTEDLRNRIFKLIFIVFTVTTAVITNPYGTGIVNQILLYSPTRIIKGVNEWYPVPRDSDIWFLLVCWSICVIFVLLKRRRNITGLYQAAISIFTAYLAFGSRRMIAPYIVATLPFVVSYFEKLRIFQRNDRKILLIDIISIFILISFISPGISRITNINIDWRTYCELNACSLKATEYIKYNPLPLRTFNFYNYGGLMIWKNPKTKVFIDGRMDQWEKEGYSVFSDHNRIIFDDDLELFNKYNFDAVYIPTTIRLYAYLQRQTRDKKWKIAYVDDISALFLKVK